VSIMEVGINMQHGSAHKVHLNSIHNAKSSALQQKGCGHKELNCYGINPEGMAIIKDFIER
jgi:hypothetical protein